MSMICQPPKLGVMSRKKEEREGVMERGSCVPEFLSLNAASRINVTRDSFSLVCQCATMHASSDTQCTYCHIYVKF